MTYIFHIWSESKSIAYSHTLLIYIYYQFLYKQEQTVNRREVTDKQGKRRIDKQKNISKIRQVNLHTENEQTGK